MNSVANRLVATMMNSSFNALNSTGLSKVGAGRDFSKVLEKVNQTEGNSQIRGKSDLHASERGLEMRSDKSEMTDKPLPKGIEDKISVTEEVTEVAEEMTEEVVEEVVETLTEGSAQEEEPIITEAENLLEAVKELLDQGFTLAQMPEEIVTTYNQALSLVSEILDMEPDQLESLLTEMGMNLMDMAHTSKLIDLVQEVYGLSDVSQLLLNGQATEAVKDIDSGLKEILETLDMDLETFEAKLNEVAVQQQPVQDSDLPVEQAAPETKTLTVTETDTALKGPVIEFEDLRQNSKTTEYDQNHQDSQGQSRETFGQMISQQVASAREVVMDSTINRATYQQITTSQVIDQIVTKAVVQLTDTKSSMQMQLNPEHLGKVAVSVTAEQGNIKGQFVVESQAVKEMLETSMIQLKAQLEEQGIKVDKIEVTIGNASQYFNQKDQSNNGQEASEKGNRSKVGRIRRMMQIEDVEALEAETATSSQSEDMMTMDIHTVEYSA